MHCMTRDILQSLDARYCAVKKFSQAVISGLSGAVAAAKKGKPNSDFRQEKLHNFHNLFFILTLDKKKLYNSNN